MIKLIKKGLTMLVTLSTITNASSNEEFKVINGSYKIRNGVITEKLKINGEAILGENTIVKEAMIVNGKLEADGVIFEDQLFSNGTITLNNSLLKNNIHLCGTIKATNSHFLKNLSLLSQKSIYSNCNFNSITIQKIPSISTGSSIYLQNGSVITGNLTFEASDGKAYLDHSSRINGIVYGGVKIYK